MIALETRQKLAKTIRLLGSDQPGEVTAAASAIVRTLAGAGATLHDLAEIVEAGSRQSVFETFEWAPSPPPPPPPVPSNEAPFPGAPRPSFGQFRPSVQRQIVRFMLDNYQLAAADRNLLEEIDEKLGARFGPYECLAVSSSVTGKVTSIWRRGAASARKSAA
jgi:hypothetical protein